MSIEQRAYIKFCFQLSKTFTETHQMMKKVYRDDCCRIHEWFKHFQEGRKALEDGERSGRPRNVVNEENRKYGNCAWIHQKRAEIIAEIHGIGIKHIRSVDLSYFDRKFGVHKGFCQICSVHFKTTRKRPQNSTFKNSTLYYIFILFDFIFALIYFYIYIFNIFIF